MEKVKKDPILYKIFEYIMITIGATLATLL